MDTHRQVSAWLSIGFGALGLFAGLFMLLFWGAASAFVATQEPWVGGLVAAVGAFVVGFVIVCSIVQILAGIFYLRGSQVGKVLLVLLNVLGLFAFPIGTVISGYCLWAMLRTLPEDQPQGGVRMVEA